MKTQRKLFYTLLFLNMLFTFNFGCVSVNLGSRKVDRATGVKYKAPDKPFYSESSPSADALWISQKTGNAISYMSECDENSNQDLKLIAQDSLGSILNMTVFEQKETLYNDRKAYEITAEGEIDGILMQIHVIVFRKNSCTYHLSYVGRKKIWNSEHEYYQNFLTSFRAR